MDGKFALKNAAGAVIGKLIGLATREHFQSEDDPFSNCPRSVDGNEFKDSDDCDCGAEQHNEKVKAVLAEWTAAVETHGG